jgi:flagellar biogenesis protein FliO
LDALKTEMAGAKPVPYIVHESAQARQERHIKRLIFALILSIAFAFASNAIWLLAWVQKERLVEGDANEKKEVLNVIGF